MAKGEDAVLGNIAAMPEPDRVIAERRQSLSGDRRPDRPIGRRAFARLGVEQNVRLVGALVGRRTAVFDERNRLRLRLPFGRRTPGNPTLAVFRVVDRLMGILPPPTVLLVA